MRLFLSSFLVFGSSRALCIAKRSRSYFCLQDESGRGTCSVEVASPDDSRRFEIAQDVEIGVYETSFYEGKLGYRVWDCSVAASTWCALNKDIFVGKRVLELGSGVGLVGLAIALLGAAAVDLTDLDGEDVDNPSGLISNLKRNIELNNLENVARARRLDWREGGDDTEYDVVVACDCVYYPEIVLPLAETIKRFLVNGQGRAVAYVISPDRDWTDAKYPRASFQDLRLALESIDCTIISTTPFLSRSPLSSQPDSLLLMEVGFTPTTTDEAWRSTTY